MNLIRPLLIVFTLALSLSAQTYNVTFDGHAAQVESGNFAKLTMPTDDGVSWRGDVTAHGNEVVVMNGALENYVGPISGQLIIADGTSGAVLFDDEVTVVDGCGFVWHSEALRWHPPSRRAVKFLNTYYAGGPSDLSIYPDEVLTFSSAGPNPDHVDPGQTGSMRVSWNRYAEGDIMRIRQELGMADDPALWAELTRWGLTDWDRSQNFYSAENGYSAWTKTDYPDSVLGAYRSDVTFGDAYGCTEQFGRPEDNAEGNWPIDTQHADNAMAVVLYAATGSWAARRSAEATCHTVFGQLLNSNWHIGPQRAAGWPLRCAALYYGATGDDAVVSYLEGVLSEIEDAQDANPGFSFVRRPYENQESAGGYIYNDTYFKEFVASYNEAFSPDVPYDSQDLSTGSAIWQEGVLGISCLLAHELAPTASLSQRFRYAALRCGYTVFVRARQPSLTEKDVTDFMANENPWSLEGIVSLSLSDPSNPSGLPLFQSITVGGRGLDYGGSIVGTVAGTVFPFAGYLTRIVPGAATYTSDIEPAFIQKFYADNYWGSGNSPKGFLMDRGREWLGKHAETSNEWPGKHWEPEDG